jgi:hypothetical protein
MFGQAGAMQLSAANLLIASQQIASGVRQPSPDVQARFAAALAKEKSAADASAFEPMEFMQAPPDQPPAPATATSRAIDCGRPGPLGAHVDIRV